MHTPLPPLNSIRAFEAAARHLSFVRASKELGVTQSAVSKQISVLESFIGAKLFERESGGVSLTLEGRELKLSIVPAFEILNTSFQKYSRRPPRSNKFRLATVASFAAHFLVPRLNIFEQHFPCVELEILTSDRVLDLNHEEIDLSIRYGSGDWDGLVTNPLVDGALIPVCSPGLMEQYENDVEALVKSHRRIQIFSKNEWRAWQTATGINVLDAQKPFIIEHFIVAVEAVLKGQAIALIPEIIIRDQLKHGHMVQFSDSVSWSQTFYVTHLPRADQRPVTRAVIAWLQEQTKI